VYALVGATAMMAGFSRSTISLCVIVIELTENTQFLFPIMTAVMSAKLCGDFFTKSIYEALMDLKSIPYLELHPPQSTFSASATDAMQTNVICFHAIERVSRIVEVLKNTKHNGFPVVSKDSDDKSKTYRGFILRKQLLILIHCKQYYPADSSGASGMIDYEYYMSQMNHSWKLEHVQLPPLDSQKDFALDLRPYMDKSQVIIQHTFSFMDAYRLFSTQALRHLPVVNEYFQVVGIFTRHDLLKFHFQSLNELSLE